MRIIDDLYNEIALAHTRESYWRYVLLYAITDDLFEAMHTKGWNHGDLAKRTGIKKSRLRRFFQGDDDMKVRDVVKIAWALGLIPSIGFRSKDES